MVSRAALGFMQLGRPGAESAGSGGWGDGWCDEVLSTRPPLNLPFAAIFILWRAFKRCCSALAVR